MLVKEVEYYKNGSSLNNPKRKFSGDDRKKYDELKKAKRNREKRKREESKFKRKIVMQVIVVSFIAGVISLALDAKVFSMQGELSNVNNNVSNVQFENEDLKVSLLHSASLEDIESNAQNKLGMMQATKGNVVNIDLSNNYFEELDIKDKEASENKEGIFDKVKGIFN